MTVSGREVYLRTPACFWGWVMVITLLLAIILKALWVLSALTGLTKLLLGPCGYV